MKLFLLTKMIHMKFLYFFILILFVGCISNKKVVTIQQVNNIDKHVVLRICDDKTAIHSLLYPLSYKIKKNKNIDIYYLDNTFLFHNITLSSGTGGCYLVPQDKNKNLSISYKNFNGVIKYIVEDNDTIKECLHKYYNEMIVKQKDTIHVSLKEFNSNFKENIINNFFEGDSIVLHFKNNEKWYNVPLRVSFN